jgi:glycosyltransferase involved in cell wall biosynthesis
MLIFKDLHVPKIRTWTINGDFLGLRPAGVARYAREVTFALDRLIASQHSLTTDLDLRLVSPREIKNINLYAIRTRTVREFGPPRIPQFWVQAQLPRFVKGGVISFCNLAPIAVRKQIVCIHDLHTILMPQTYGLGFRLTHRLLLPVLGRTARKITTVSNLSKSHLVTHGIAPSNKITVTYNGCDHAVSWNSNIAFPIGQRPFVLFLGQPQKYKNAELVWRIAPALDRQGIDVYVAGTMDDASIRSLGEPLPSNLRLLGRITDDEFAAAFKNALCFLFPSRIEGFGLPLVEAMTRGCPVIASSSPCMPEVGGDAALYCDPDDPEGWIAQIVRLRSDSGLREELRSKGLRRAEIYTWENVALLYLRLMAEIDGIELTPEIRTKVMFAAKDNRESEEN